MGNYFFLFYRFYVSEHWTYKIYNNCQKDIFIIEIVNLGNSDNAERQKVLSVKNTMVKTRGKQLFEKYMWQMKLFVSEIQTMTKKSENIGRNVMKKTLKLFFKKQKAENTSSKNQSNNHSGSGSLSE